MACPLKCRGAPNPHPPHGRSNPHNTRPHGHGHGHGHGPYHPVHLTRPPSSTLAQRRHVHDRATEHQRHAYPALVECTLGWVPNERVLVPQGGASLHLPSIDAYAGGVTLFMIVYGFNPYTCTKWQIELTWVPEGSPESCLPARRRRLSLHVSCQRPSQGRCGDRPHARSGGRWGVTPQPQPPQRAGHLPQSPRPPATQPVGSCSGDGDDGSAAASNRDAHQGGRQHVPQGLVSLPRKGRRQG